MSLIQQNMGAIYDGSQRLIAPVLNSTTATQNWEVGQEFILDGNLYKVTTAIPSGSQIIVSGSSANCELADTVTEQINDMAIITKPITEPQPGFGGVVRYDTHSQILYVNLIRCPALAHNEKKVICNIPELIGKVTLNTYYLIVWAISSGSAPSTVGNCYVTIDNNGDVAIYNYGVAIGAGYYYMNCSAIIGDSQ